MTGGSSPRAGQGMQVRNDRAVLSRLREELAALRPAADSGSGGESS